MYPMSGIGEGDDASVSEVFRAPVFLGIGRPAFIAVAKQGGTTDRAPQLLQLFRRDVDGRKHSNIVVELPTPRAVFVAARRMLREVLSLVGAQILIFAAHALQRIG